MKLFDEFVQMHEKRILAKKKKKRTCLLPGASYDIEEDVQFFLHPHASCRVSVCFSYRVTLNSVREKSFQKLTASCSE